MSDHDDPGSTGDADLDLPATATTQPLSLNGSFGTAVGAAMLGFEQALRNLPPAETLAAEHAPRSGLAGDGHDLVLHFPDPLRDPRGETGTGDQ